MTDHLLHHKVAKLIRQHRLLDSGDSLVVGVSGGIDSTALLLVLHNLDLDIRPIAVYVDHGLRPDETGKEIRFIGDLCEKLDIPHHIRSVDVASHANRYGCSIEESGRILRHQILEDIRKQTKASAIALGHTADDQVEEFFIRLVRGSGPKGLSGMRLKSNHIIRPLLNEKKSDLLEYLSSINQKYCHDSSNESRDFLRNRVRLDLLPLLTKDFNPSINKTVLETMSILQDEEELLDSLCQDAFTRLCTTKREPKAAAATQAITLDCHGLSKEHRAIQKRIMEKVCWRMNTSPSTRIIYQLLELALLSDRGSKMHLAKGLRVRKEMDRLVFEYPRGQQSVRGELDTTLTFCHRINGPGRYHIAEIDSTINLAEISQVEITGEGDHLFLSSDKLSYPLTVRTVEEGERFTPPGAPGSKKINRFLTDLKIPSHKRRTYPVISDKNGVVAIAGLRVAERVRVQPGDTKITRLSLIRQNVENEQAD